MHAVRVKPLRGIPKHRDHLDVGKEVTDVPRGARVAQVDGGSGFTVGWGHLKLDPGLNAKIAMRFDYGRFNQTISAIEVGLTSEFYLSKVAQVYVVPQKQFFFNGYVSIMFGGRK